MSSFSEIRLVEVSGFLAALQGFFLILQSSLRQLSHRIRGAESGEDEVGRALKCNMWPGDHTRPTRCCASAAPATRFGAVGIKRRVGREQRAGSDTTRGAAARCACVLRFALSS